MQNLHDIVDEKIIERTENSVTLETVIPKSSDFFDGHFPEYKLLPAVAQFEVVTRFAKKFFEIARWVPAIKRIKFSAPIRPDTKIKLEMKYKPEKNLVSYTISNANKPEIVYSIGSFTAVTETKGAAKALDAAIA